MDNIESILNGDRLTLSRMLTHVENDDPRGRQVLDGLFRYTGRAHLVGITGSPGTGKSSLANQLAKLIRNPGGYQMRKTVAIVAVDPTSPFTGGAILGDRVRMKDLHGDEGVFIRSMASRGALGGIARATAAVVQVLDAAGFDLILIETVGAGQAEVEIARLAHTTIVVEAPGLGDDIQAIKAGILEIADILVVNKADLPGAENAERALRMNLELAHTTRPAEGWQVPVLRTVSLSGEGAAEVLAAIGKHAEYLRLSGEWEKRDRERLRAELETLVGLRLMDAWRARIVKKDYNELLRQVEKRKLSPYQAAEKLAKQ
jgi:LAO/AO transport system kinase